MKTRMHITAATAVTLAVAAGAAPAPAAVTYPSTLPDFAHRSEPHSRLFSQMGGNQDRPMLVIYAQFANVAFPAGIDAPAMARRFFGPFPSVAGYFADDSRGRLLLRAASERNGSLGGAADDGVVAVTIAQEKSAFNQQDKEEQIRDLLRAADPHVNFRGFDRNDDGQLKSDELVVHRVDADPDDVSKGSGQTKYSYPLSLDGVKLGGLAMALGGTDTNLMTLIHETGHAAFEMPDTYYWSVGAFDLGGATARTDDGRLFRNSAYQKLHLGWITPTVVTRDGYRDLGQIATTGKALLLYDPAKGVDDYFLVENRARTSGTYDQRVDDSGLVIWRIDDSIYTRRGEGSDNGANADGGFIYPIRPVVDAAGHDSAWNPADGGTPQRAMSSPWRDGTASKVAVRAVGPAGSSIRAYYDVRGPGILVDTYPVAPPSLVRGRCTQVSIPVMNTGEMSDSFTFTAASLPSGWKASTTTRTLGASSASTASIALTPPTTAPAGSYTIRVVGRSKTDSSVTSNAPLRVTVPATLPDDRPCLIGPTTVDPG